MVAHGQAMPGHAGEGAAASPGENAQPGLPLFPDPHMTRPQILHAIYLEPMFIKLVGFQKLLVDFFLKKVSSLSPAHHALKTALDALGTFQPAPVDSARGRRGQEPPAQTHSYTQHLTAVRAEHTLSGASSWSVCVFPLLRCFRLSLGSFSLGSEDLERLLFV